MAGFEELADVGEERPDEEHGAAGVFAGLTESAEIVVVQGGDDATGVNDALLMSLLVSDLVAEYVDMRTDHGAHALAGSALEGARNVREDLVAALKIVNAALLRAEVAAVSAPKMG